MESLIENRRDFLKHVSIAAAFPFLLNCKGGTLAQESERDILSSIKKNAIADPASNWSGAGDAPSDVGWTTKLAPDSDKGERIFISGTVFQADGKTPAPKTLIYLYHTDIYGVYGQNGEHRHGRYRGWMLTNSEGKYQFESIKPASYPNSTIAAHVHMTTTSRERKEDWIDSILFEGDRFISARERIPQKGGFQPIVQLTKRNDGKSYAIRDILLA